ncbi:MAG: hypothetical protein ABSC38_06250 [Verrucomicrobiia bacterium]|jgi:hypothetical protein
MIASRILRTTKRLWLGGVMGGMMVLGVQALAVTVSNDVIDVSMAMDGEVQGTNKQGIAFAAPVNLTHRDLMNLALGLRPRTHVSDEAVLGLVQLHGTNVLPLIVFDVKGSSNAVTVGSVTIDPAQPTRKLRAGTLFAELNLLNVGGVSNRIVSGQFFFAGNATFGTNGCLTRLDGTGVGTLAARFNATNATDDLVYRTRFRTSGSKLGVLTNATDFSVDEASPGTFVSP